MASTQRQPAGWISKPICLDEDPHRMQDNPSRISRICETANSSTKNQGSKRNHEQHLWHGWTGSAIGSGVIHGGYARPGIDGPRRFDRRAGGGNNHLDLRSPCLGRGAASDAVGGHSTQRDGPGVRQAGAGAAWDGGLFRRHGNPFLFALAWGVLFAYLWPI